MVRSDVLPGPVLTLELTTATFQPRISRRGAQWLTFVSLGPTRARWCNILLGFHGALYLIAFMIVALVL